MLNFSIKSSRHYHGFLLSEENFTLVEEALSFVLVVSITEEFENIWPKISNVIEAQNDNGSNLIFLGFPGVCSMVRSERDMNTIPLTLFKLEPEKSKTGVGGKMY